MSVWLDEINKMHELIPQIYLPEFFICKLLNGDLYYNPILDYGLYVSFEYQEPSYSGYSNCWQLVRHVRKVCGRISHTSPSPVYQELIRIYKQHNIELPRDLELFFTLEFLPELIKNKAGQK